MDPKDVEGRTSTIYPEPFRKMVEGRVKRKLGDAVGLNDFGVNLVELAPGAASALRHWHTEEDEFVYVLSGTITLVTDEGEQELPAGHFAGFPKNVPNGHHLVNKSDGIATYLEIGSRCPTDRAAYPDHDLAFERPANFTHKDGTPY